jgi:hypothetical protein
MTRDVPIKITDPRHTEGRSNELLENFVFGGHYGPYRIPRGIHPPLVAAFLQRRIDADADSNDLSKALDLARFYEAVAAVPHFVTLLRPANDNPSLHVQLLLCQLIGDLGPADLAKRAADHLNRLLVPRTETIRLARIALETVVVLAPHATFDTLAARLDAELRRLAPDRRSSEAAMMDHDRLAAVIRNDLPRLRLVADAKAKLTSKDAAERRPLLVEVYLGRDNLRDAYLQVWAARMLRAEALAIRGQPAQLEFERVLDSIDPAELGEKPATDVLARRAERALRYFGGLLSQEQRDRLSKVKRSSMDFLDDDD